VLSCLPIKNIFLIFTPKQNSLKNLLKEKPSTKFNEFCVKLSSEMCATLWYICYFLWIFCLVSIQNFLLKPPFGKFLNLIKNVIKSKDNSFCLYGRTNIQTGKHLHHLYCVVLFLSGNGINIFRYISIINFKRSVFMSKMLLNVQQLTNMNWYWC